MIVRANERDDEDDAARRDLPRGRPDTVAGEDASVTPSRSTDPGRFVEGPSGRLIVRIAGDDGAALLLVHGLGGSGAQWTPQLQALGSSMRVVALDLRAHGRSEPPRDGEHGIGAFADDVLAIAGALGLDRFALAGHSLGALVALEVASREPARVTALALVDPSGDATGEPEAAIARTLAQLAEDPRAEFTHHYREFLHGARASTTKRVLADLAATPEAALLGGYAAAMRYPTRERLRAWRGPVLCVASALNDSPGSLPHDVPELATEWLAPASHWLMLDRPEQVSGLLAELVAGASRTR